MTHSKKDDDEYDLFKTHIRGYYVEKPRFPLDYPPLPKVRLSISRSLRPSPPEAVFKIASFIKTKTEAARTVLYIAEHSEGLTETVTLYDEERCDFKPEEAKKKLDDIAFEQDRKNSRKMIHFIVSFPNKMNLSENDVKLFMARYLEPFGVEGYAYLYGVHRHQSAMHGHVIMTLSNGRAPKLRFRKREIQQMRSHQVEVAKTFGWEMRATRCKDREIDITGRKAEPKKKTLLERQVPNWCKKRKLENDFSITKYPINKAAQTTLSAWSRVFNNPPKAEQLFIEMYAENKKTAFWYANNKPDVFGGLNAVPTTKLSERNFSVNTAETELVYSTKTKSADKMQNLSLER